MKCRDVVELMSDYLEDALTPAERARFEDHIAGCDGCRAYLEQLRVTLRAVRQIADEPVPENVERQLVEAFRDWKRTAH